MNSKEIKKVCVLGAGIMGPGIAQSYAAYGCEVTLYSISNKELIKAKSVIETNLNTFVEEELYREGEIDAILHRINYTDCLKDAVSDAQYIVEAIVEDSKIKKELFYEINRYCDGDAIIASNTSYLNIFELMPPERQKNSIITHWFAPPHIIPLVEVVRGPKTSVETIKCTMELLTASGKTPLLINEYLPGFVINRLQHILTWEVFHLLDNGYITPEQLDLSVKASLAPRMMALGVVQRYDFNGLDLVANNLKNEKITEPPINRQPRCIVEKIERAELGIKTGKGFYDYSGKSFEEISKERDKKLIKILKSMKPCLNTL